MATQRKHYFRFHTKSDNSFSSLTVLTRKKGGKVEEGMGENKGKSQKTGGKKCKKIFKKS